MSATEIRPSAHSQAEASACPPAVSALLDDLGARLDQAFASHTPRLVGRRVISAAALLAAATAVGAYALTRPGPGRPPLPSSPPAVQGLLARGTTANVSWELGRTACGRRGGDALTLATLDGSARTGCAGGAARPLSSYYDQRANTALVFGTAPAGTTKVEIADSGGAQSASALTSTSSAVVFVGAMAMARTATALTAYGPGGRLLEACNERACVAP